MNKCYRCKKDMPEIWEMKHGIDFNWVYCDNKKNQIVCISCLKDDDVRADSYNGVLIKKTLKQFNNDCEKVKSFWNDIKKIEGYNNNIAGLSFGIYINEVNNKYKQV